MHIHRRCRAFAHGQNDMHYQLMLYSDVLCPCSSMEKTKGNIGESLGPSSLDDLFAQVASPHVARRCCLTSHDLAKRRIARRGGKLPSAV
eukprot:353069-Chlamydomonas_euryale.AAC.35